jgi:hypothetical protein
MFSIKHIAREENSRANRLAQQASGYVVTQGGFWVTLVSLVENMYALSSKGKSIVENSDRLEDKGKPISDKAHWLTENSEPEANEESVIKENEFEKPVRSQLQRKTSLRRLGHP